MTCTRHDVASIGFDEGVRVRQDWEPEDLIEVWTLLEDDTKKLRNKSGASRLGFAMLLKFFEVEARFPESDSASRGGGLCGSAGEGGGGEVGGVRLAGPGGHPSPG